MIVIQVIKNGIYFKSRYHLKSHSIFAITSCITGVYRGILSGIEMPSQIQFSRQQISVIYNEF